MGRLGCGYGGVGGGEFVFSVILMHEESVYTYINLYGKT